MEYECGNIYIRPNHIYYKAGACPGHKHDFDHTTICFHGSALIEEMRGDTNVIERSVILRSPRPGYDGPSHALIKAHVIHRITALEDDTIFWCVYSHRNAQGEVVQVYEGFDAYNVHA